MVISSSSKVGTSTGESPNAVVAAEPLIGATAATTPLMTPDCKKLRREGRSGISFALFVFNGPAFRTTQNRNFGLDYPAKGELIPNSCHNLRYFGFLGCRQRQQRHSRRPAIIPIQIAGKLNPRNPQLATHARRRATDPLLLLLSKHGVFFLPRGVDLMASLRSTRRQSQHRSSRSRFVRIEERP